MRRADDGAPLCRTPSNHDLTMARIEQTALQNNSPQEARPAMAIYLGLFLLTAATLLFELGLTRIFSVLMYYHMAFFAVSVTLFGLATGGVVVHFFPRLFSHARAPSWMGWMACGFAISLVLALAVIYSINFDMQRNRVLFPQLLLVSFALAVPFTCSGVAVALALTRWPNHTNTLYAADLCGAALGCLLFAPLITGFGGEGFMLLIAGIVALGAVVFSFAATQKRGVRFVRAAGFLVCAGTVSLFVFRANIPLLQIRYARGVAYDTSASPFDKWNSISRVTVFPYRGPANGVAPEFADQSIANQQMMTLDTLAATPILEFDGIHFEDQFFAFHDVAYAAHAVVGEANVAVIGVGGGRDVLAAKAWGQPSVTGIEINSRVLEATGEVFHDYAGRPKTWPGVRLVQDEARSYITRSGETFDIIQASLIDTFAATAAGAFVLTENSLYTTQGWKVFFDHLSNRGVITMTRWYTSGAPVESIRLLALARASLEEQGVEKPIDHILMARTPPPGRPEEQPLATIVVKKTPFASEEVEAFRAWIKQNHFIELVTPFGVEDDELRGVIEAPDLADFVASHAFDVSPPTDEKPFFFDVLRWRDVFKKEYRQGSNYIFSINLKPVFMLGTLLLSVVVLAFVVVVLPLWIEGWIKPSAFAREQPLARRLSAATYFAMLGMGYIVIELTLMQRFTLFLGHPSYSLTVVLFSMLLMSGIGSGTARRFFPEVGPEKAPRQLARLNLIVCASAAAAYFIAQGAIQLLAPSPTPVRMAVAVALISPIAFLMGMPFPLAIQAASARKDAPLSWYWGINGAMSVCASVLTIVLAHAWGLTFAYMFGSACYLVAAAMAPGFRYAKVQ